MRQNTMRSFSDWFQNCSLMVDNIFKMSFSKLHIVVNFFYLFSVMAYIKLYYSEILFENSPGLENFMSRNNYNEEMEFYQIKQKHANKHYTYFLTANLIVSSLWVATITLVFLSLPAFISSWTSSITLVKVLWYISDVAS